MVLMIEQSNIYTFFISLIAYFNSENSGVFEW